MNITIYDRVGNPKADISPNDSSTQVKEIQGDNVLTLSFTHYEHIVLDVDDYTDFEGERYWLTEAYRPKQKSTREWTYDLKLYGIESLLKNILVIKRVDGEDDPVFTLTAPPREHVAMIVNCMNDGMGGIADWKVGRVDGTENIVIDYHGKYCDEALREIAGKVGAEWWAEGQTVNVCRCEYGEPVALGYNKGLTSIDPGMANNVKFYTRLFPVGSSRNIDPERYGHTRLQLPGGQKYVEINEDKYGRVDHYEDAAFADIYPRRIGEVSSVRSEVRTGEDGTPFTIYYFRDDSLPFDPNDYEISGLVKRVSFQEGSELGGLGNEDNGTYYFEVNFNSETREFEIITIWPYDNDTQLPGGSLIPAVGDKYILWNIRMPDEYYTLAEEELMTAVNRYNAEHGLDVSVFKAPTDHVWIEDSNVNLSVGRRVRLESDFYFPETGYRDSRITRITRKVNLPSSMDIEIGDALSRTAMQKMSDGIRDAQAYAKSIGETISLPDIIRTGDRTRPTDNNLMSALRIILGFLSKTGDDRTSGKLASDKAFELGRFLSGVSGGMFGIDEITGDSFLEVARLYVRGKAFFEQLMVIQAGVLAGKRYVTPGGGVKCTRVEEVHDDAGSVTGWRCYYLSEQDGERTECAIVAGDQAIVQQFSMRGGEADAVGNRRYWRLVTAVENDAETDSAGNHYGYVELSATDCEAGSDVPSVGDEICQLGNKTDRTRQSAIVISTVDVDSPCIKLFGGIDSYSLDGRAVVAFGVDAVTGKVYFRLGNSGAKQFLEFSQGDGLKVAGSISALSTYDDGSDTGKTLQEVIEEKITDTDVLYISHTSQTEAPELPVVDLNGVITDLKGWATTAPAWDAERYIWQTTYVRRGDGSATFSDPTCIQGASVSMTANEVRYSTVHTASQPADSTFTLTAVPTLSAGQYLWSRTTVTYNNGHNTVSYAVSRVGTDGTSVTIVSTSVTYAKTTGTAQPADSTFTYSSIGAAGVRPGEYLWTKTVATYSDGNSTKSYSVGRVGSDGANGTPGAPGADGKTPYIHWAYANSADGTKDFSTSYFDNALYMGICSDYNQADPTTPSSYEWARTRGQDGDSAKVVIVNADNTVFTYKDDFKTLVAPASITLTATLQNVSGYQWSYKPQGASSFTNISGGTGQTLVVSPTNTTYFPSLARSCVFRCTSGGVYDEVTIAKVSSGTNGVDGAKTIILESPSGDAKYYPYKATLADWERWASSSTAFWPAGNINSIVVGDTVIVRGIVSDKNNAECYLMGEVISKANGNVYIDANTSSLIYGQPGADAYTVLLTNESHIFKGDTTKAIAASAECGIIAYKGATQVAATIGSITGMPTGMTVAISNNGTTSTKFTVSVTTALTTKQGTLNVPITVDGKSFTRKFSWSLSLDGVGISSTVEMFAVNNDPDNPPADNEFTTTVPQTSTSKRYLWNYEIVTYSDNTPKSTNKRVIGVHGQNGTDGAGISKIENFYLASANASGITTSTTGWTTDASSANATVSETKPYLWNYERVTYTKGNPTTTTPHVVGKYGVDGNGILRIEEEYYLSTSRTQLLGGSWSTTRQPWVAGRYYWTRSHIYYTDGTDDYTDAVCVTGNDGPAGASVARLDLDNEMVQIACDAYGAAVAGQFPVISNARVYLGGAIDTGWSFSKVDTNCGSSIDSAGQIRVNGLTADKATVKVTATKSGFADLTATMTLAKVRAGTPGTNGTNGTNGKDAVIYQLQPSVNAITRSISGELSANSIDVTKYKTTGSSPRAATTEKYLYRRLVGKETTPVYVGTTAATYTLSNLSSLLTATVTAVEFSLYKTNSASGELLDRETIPVLTDARGLGAAQRNMALNSGGWDRKNGEILLWVDYFPHWQFLNGGCVTKIENGKFVLYKDVAANGSGDGRNGLVEDVAVQKFPAGTVLTLRIKGKVQLTSGFVRWRIFRTDTWGVMDFGRVTSSRDIDETYTITLPEDWPKPQLAFELRDAGVGSSITLESVGLYNGTIIPSQWEAAPEDKDYLYQALRQAQRENTQIDGGLILSTLIKLGYTDAATGLFKIMSGMSGFVQNANGSSDPAIWMGGDPSDTNNQPQSMLYHSGTGYFAGGVFQVLKESIEILDLEKRIQGDQSKVVLDKAGLHLIDSQGREALRVANVSLGSTPQSGRTINASSSPNWVQFIYNSALSSYGLEVYGDKWNKTLTFPSSDGMITADNATVKVTIRFDIIAQQTFPDQVFRYDWEFYVNYASGETDTLTASGQGSALKNGTNTFTHTFTISPAKGECINSISISNGRNNIPNPQPPYSLLDANATIYATAEISYSYPDSVVIGNNGIMASQGSAVLMCTKQEGASDGETEMGVGTYGLKITNTGFKYKSGGSDWKSWNPGT